MGFRIPSLVKLPRNRRFEFEPRYYDPIKERVENRAKAIGAEINGEAVGDTASRIRGSFGRPAKRSARGGAFQGFFILAFATSLGAFLYFGNIAIWIAAGLIGLYVLAKILRLSK